MDKSKKIVVGADHFGMPLKDVVRDHLRGLGYQVDDMGVNSDDPVDYPDVGASLAEAVAAGEYRARRAGVRDGCGHGHRGEQGARRARRGGD